MEVAAQSEITVLLKDWRGGDSDALDRLTYGVDWTDRAHFFAVSAQVMRRILVDAAKAASAGSEAATHQS